MVTCGAIVRSCDFGGKRRHEKLTELQLFQRFRISKGIAG